MELHTILTIPDVGEIFRENIVRTAPQNTVKEYADADNIYPR
jgi:hypothetical protein